MNHDWGEPIMGLPEEKPPSGVINETCLCWMLAVPMLLIIGDWLMKLGG